MGGYTGRSFFVVVLDPDATVKFVDIGESTDLDFVTSGCTASADQLPAPPPELSRANSSQPAPGSSIADELKKLADLKNSGALTEAEFQAAKQRLLGATGQQ
jgi:hypothetical protein